MTTRMYGVYYRVSEYQDWQFYVGSPDIVTAKCDARDYISRHAGHDVMVATYPEGYPESWRVIKWQFSGITKTAPISTAISAIVNTLDADWF